MVLQPQVMEEYGVKAWYRFKDDILYILDADHATHRALLAQLRKRSSFFKLIG